MRIVFAAPRLPYPPNRGDKIRTFYHLSHLARRHEIHLVCLAGSDEDRHAEALRELCASQSIVTFDPFSAAARCAAAIANGSSLATAYMSPPALTRAARDIATAVDADVLWIANGALWPSLVGVPARRRVVDLVDVDSDKWRQMAESARGPLAAIYRREARLTSLQEEIARRDADLCLVISDEEARLLRGQAPGLPSPAVVPAAIDLDAWPRRPSVAAPSLIFTGRLDYRPNADAVSFFAAEVLPVIRRHLPAARFTAVGARPPRRLRRTAARFNFEIAADVADVRPYFAAARVCVAPMRLGRGVQNKVLEAMASGVPVVASPLALAGLAEWDERIALCGRSPDELARACRDLLTDDALAAELAAAASRFVAVRHARDVALTALDDLLDGWDGAGRPAAAGAAR